MPLNRWELAKHREDEERARRQQEFPRWLTPWRSALLFTIPFLVFLGIGLGVYAYDAPLRDPHLPHVKATVIKHFSGKNEPIKVHYRLPDGRAFDEQVDWAGRGEPAVGAPITIAYVASQPSRFRIVGHSTHAGYVFPFLIAGALLLVGLGVTARAWQNAHSVPS